MLHEIELPHSGSLRAEQPPTRRHAGGGAAIGATLGCRVAGATKRSLDVALSLVVLVLLLPLLALIAAAIKLDSPGPVFYRSRRVGRQGRHFGMLKFRKMRHDAAGAPLTIRTDPRLTRVGKLLTRTRLDELPQLWDVLTGRMSIVGPRPEDPRFVALHLEEYRHILMVRPGITGLSQLAYAAEQHILVEDNPVEDYLNRVLPQKLRLDTLYASSWTLVMDLRILFWTAATVGLGKPVAVHRRTGAMNLRKPRTPQIQLSPVVEPAPPPAAVLSIRPARLPSSAPAPGSEEPAAMTPAARESAA